MLCLILLPMKIILGWKNFCFSELYFHIELFDKSLGKISVYCTPISQS